MKHQLLFLSLFMMLSYTMTEEKKEKPFGLEKIQKIANENLYSFGRGIQTGTADLMESCLAGIGIGLSGAILRCTAPESLKELSSIAYYILFLGVYSLIKVRNIKKINEEVFNKNKNNEYPLLSDLTGYSSHMFTKAISITVISSLVGSTLSTYLSPKRSLK